MQYQQIQQRKPAESVGEAIDIDYAWQLIRGFREKFPGETSDIVISSSTIFVSVKDLSNVSGIRFMYCMESADDPASLTILMIPCNNTSDELSIPTTIVQHCETSLC